VEADSLNTTARRGDVQEVRAEDWKPSARSVADRKVRFSGVGLQGGRPLSFPPQGGPQAQIGCHLERVSKGEPEGRGRSPCAAPYKSSYPKINRKSSGEALLACQYRNKGPHVATKEVTGTFESTTGAYSPKYINACRVGAWSIVTWPVADPSEVKFRKFKCRSWRHEGECSRWKGAQDFARIASALKENRGSWTYIVQTFARDREFRNPYEAYKGLYFCWAKQRKRIFRKWKDFKYITLVEKHRDRTDKETGEIIQGWPHLNILIRNEALAKACAGDGWKSVRRNWLEPVAKACGFGMRTWIEPVRGSEKMAGYFVKLCGTAGELSKPSQSPDNAPKNFRRLRASQGLLPLPYKNPDFTGCLEKEPLEIVEHRWEMVKENGMKRMTDSHTGKCFQVATAKEIQAKFKIATSTLFRWQRSGMPVIKMGYWSYYPVAKVRAWLKVNQPIKNTGRYRLSGGGK